MPHELDTTVNTVLSVVKLSGLMAGAPAGLMLVNRITTLDVVPTFTGCPGPSGWR
jgi:hypothetical protein